ncbi:MAG: CoB--CoM heterodisulfide reductase iron-sulfur subunit A family protein [Firmicutes bacterium]|jgi:heterodisulfide reductase subunit A|nr:CoB--CoM heterodisulfide reductase iron-sulfur subunit A family protein [Bacillota bacterium]MDH7494492.1 CoB--CoM heterodisulfide reductase iron-sulfur subunit A family protein [Bacillota bacterium]
MRTGVFVCWCGLNIGGVVDVPEVVRVISSYPGVACALDYRYMCSDPGQQLIKDTIRRERLDSVVVAACSPAMHEATFQSVAASAGVNPYRCEIANIREQCSWPHQDEPGKATSKALELVRAAVEKARGDEELSALSVPLTRRALVIGAGIAGMQAALDIAEAGHEVVLVERQAHIGGHMAQLSETFPTLDCSQCILTPKTSEVGRHPRIKLLTNSDIESVSGYVGNFSVKIRRKATYVNWDVCTGCGLCTEKCPSKKPSVFERGLSQEPAIAIAFPQAVPHKPVISAEACRHFTKGKCGVCERACPAGAIDFGQRDSLVEEQVGAIVVATGYDLHPKAKVGEYGYGVYPDVIDGLEFERLNSASGPTQGEIRRPSDGKVPKEVVFIQCVGSRDQENGYPYCSKICCMYTAKHARLYKHKVPDGQPYVFYMDVRAGGKGYEEFVQQAMDEGVLYLRGRVARVFQDGDGLAVLGVDTLSGKKVEVRADMVVLATAIVPSSGAKDLAQLLKTAVDQFGFLSEAHPKLRPVESLTRGIYIAGCAQAPKDIPDTVTQAGSAAAKVLALFSAERLSHSPTVAAVDEELCSGCGICVKACAYEARTLDPTRRVATVNDVLCEGCGACVVACPNGATRQKNMTRSQVLSMIDAVMG